MEGGKSSRRLFVGGLFQGITDDDLKDRFSRFGDVSGVDIRARKDNLGTILKTFAYLNISITEADYKKCGVTFNKSKWRGNEMEIQIAKESFVDRLKKEREEAAMMKSLPEKSTPVVPPVDLLVKGAVPGTLVDGKKDWVVGKYGRALPVVNIRTKNKKKVITVDPSKYVHGVKLFEHGKNVVSTEDYQAPINKLTWSIDVQETDITKKIKGIFPVTKKTVPKRKHVVEPVQEKRIEYHSNSDSCSSDDVKMPKRKKAKPAEASTYIAEKKSPVEKVKHLVTKKSKGSIDETSTLNDISNQTDALIQLHKRDSGINTTAETLAILAQLENSRKKLMILQGLKRKSTCSNTDSSSSDDSVAEVDTNHHNESQTNSQKVSDNHSDIATNNDNVVSTSTVQNIIKSKSSTIEKKSSNKLSGKPNKKVRKLSGVSDSPKVIQFDPDIGCDVDEDAQCKKGVNGNMRNIQLHKGNQHPTFANVNSVDEFGVGMLVDNISKQVPSVRERKYKSGGFSSEEDLLDAASAGRFKKLDNIAKIAALRQKYVDLPSTTNSAPLPVTRVYNSDVDDSDELFEKVQQAPKRLKQKTVQVKEFSVKKVVGKNVEAQKKSAGFSSDSDDETSTNDQFISKRANGTTPKKVLHKKASVRQVEDSSSSSDEEVQQKSLPKSGTKASAMSAKSSRVIPLLPVPQVITKDNTKDIVIVGEKYAESSDLESLTSDVSGSDIEDEVNQFSKLNSQSILKVSSEHGTKELSKLSVNDVTAKPNENIKPPKDKQNLVTNKAKQLSSTSSDTSDSESSIREVSIAKSSTLKSNVTKTTVIGNKPKIVSTKAPNSSSSSNTSDSELATKKLSQTKSSVLKSNVKKSVVKKNVSNTSSSSDTTDSNSSDSESCPEDVGQTKSSALKSAVTKSTVIDNKPDSTTRKTSISTINSPKKPTKHKVVNAKYQSSSSSSNDTTDSESSVEESRQKINQTIPCSVSNVNENAESSNRKAKIPKINKMFPDSNQRRLDSLKQRSHEAKTQKILLKQALSSMETDTSKAKKIVFDSASDDEVTTPHNTLLNSRSDSGSDNSSEQPSSKQKTTKVEKKGPALFTNDGTESEDDDDDDRFRVRPQFEGSGGRKLIKMQSHFGNDPRFKFTEKFIDSEEESEEAEGENEAAVDTVQGAETNERKRTLAILNDVVTCTQSKKNKPTAFKDMSLQQYDPTKLEHKQFEIQVEKKKETKKQKRKVPAESVEPEPIPEVSGEKFFEVQSSLKDMFNTGDGKKPFSLLDMLGRSESEPSQKQHDDPVATIKQKKLWHQFDSADDDDGDSTDDEQGVSSEEMSTRVTHVPVNVPQAGQRGFFFVENDLRISEGIDFYQRKGELEEIREKWAEQRPELVDAYKHKRKRFKFMKRNEDNATTSTFQRGRGRGTSRARGRGRGGRGHR